MKLLSVNVSLPREVAFQEGTVETGIFKEPINGRVMMRRLNLDGDRQADLTVHGGPDKAVYGYPAEHYDFWRGELPGMKLAPGMFGENFTIEGLLEADAHIGDRFAIGGAEVVVTQPRLPCYKLGIKFGRADMVKRFLASGRTGYYFSVAREGEVGAGDEILSVSRDPHAIAVPEITRLYLKKHYTTTDFDTMQRLVTVPEMAEGWRSYFLERLAVAKPH